MREGGGEEVREGEREGGREGGGRREGGGGRKRERRREGGKGEGKEGGENARRVWLSRWLTWPHPGFLELFVDETHLVQRALNLLDAVGRRQGPGDGRVKGHR